LTMPLEIGAFLIFYNAFCHACLQRGVMTFL
jgi:hypothetical protein